MTPVVRVAVICLAPAIGHLISLLKIAANAGQDADVVVIVPDELKEAAEYYGFRCESIGPVRPSEGGSALQAYIHASELSRVLGKLRRCDSEYFFPLRVAVRRCFPHIMSILIRFRPTCILADDAIPFFRKELNQLSMALDVPVLLHDSGLHHNTWTHRSCYFHDFNSLLHDAKEKTKNESLLLLERPRTRLSLSQLGTCDCLSALTFPSVRGRVTRVLSGTRFLERCFLSGCLQHGNVERVVLPTLPPLQGNLAPDLVTWLKSAQTPVVYISLGTIIVDGEVLAEVIRAVVRSGKRALVQCGAPGPQGFDPREVRMEVWLPQATAMAHPAVSLVVTHGGSGTVEEALWMGKPLVCIPHAWDQYYNAWVASALGVAVRVGKRKGALRRRLPGAILQALAGHYTDNAQCTSRIMRRCWHSAGHRVAELFSPSAVIM